MKQVIDLNAVELLKEYDVYKTYNVEDTMGEVHYNVILPIDKEDPVVAALEKGMTIEIFLNPKDNLQVNVDNFAALNQSSDVSVMSAEESGSHPSVYFSAIFTGLCGLHKEGFAALSTKKDERELQDKIFSDAILYAMEAYNKFNDVLLNRN